MPINILFSTLILTCTIFHSITSQVPTREYVVRTDFFSGGKADEFAVYDTSEKNVHYRIESSYNIMQTLKVLGYPSKQEVARLQQKLHLLTYKGEFSILDSKTNGWINGVIQQKFTAFRGEFQIDLNGHSLKMETEFGSFTTKVLDTDGRLLAQFRLRPSSIFFYKKYDMKVFTNKYPDQIYFLGLAAYHHSHRDRGKKDKNDCNDELCG